jgi:hypothetical protein
MPEQHRIKYPQSESAGDRAGSSPAATLKLSRRRRPLPARKFKREDERNADRLRQASQASLHANFNRSDHFPLRLSAFARNYYHAKAQRRKGRPEDDN